MIIQFERPEFDADPPPYPGWLRLLIWLGVMAFGVWCWYELMILIAS